MPGHDTSSFVSRDRGLAGSSMEEFFAPQSGFGEGWPQHSRTSSEPTYGRQEKPHHVRRLTVNRKPLRNDASLAQPLHGAKRVILRCGASRLSHLLQFFAGFFPYFPSGLAEEKPPRPNGSSPRSSGWLDQRPGWCASTALRVASR